MQLSAAGINSDILWHEVKNQATNIELDGFVVTANHQQSILILNGNDTGD